MIINNSIKVHIKQEQSDYVNNLNIRPNHLTNEQTSKLMSLCNT